MWSGRDVFCYRWKMLRRSWRPLLLRDLEGSRSLLELPKAAVFPEKWGPGRVVSLPSPNRLYPRKSLVDF